MYQMVQGKVLDWLHKHVIPRIKPGKTLTHPNEKTREMIHSAAKKKY